MKKVNDEIIETIKKDNPKLLENQTSYSNTNPIRENNNNKNENIQTQEIQIPE